MLEVRDALCFLVLASLAGTASAEMAPEDPYTEVEPTSKTEPAITLELDATSGVGPVVAMPAATVNGVSVDGAAAAGVAKLEPAAKVESVASTVTPNATSQSVDPFEEGEWYEQQEVQIGGGVGVGLLFLGLLIRGRRVAGRRRLAREQRRTQFGMSAVDPSLAKLNVAAWEHGPAVMPIAIEPEMMNRRAQSAPFVQPEPSFVEPPFAGRAPSAPIISSAQPFLPSLVPQPVAPIAQPVVAPARPPVAPASQPYQHYSNADLAAYGLRPSQPAIVDPAPRKSEPKMVMMPHLMQTPGLPAAHVPLPPMPIAGAHMPNARHAQPPMPTSIAHAPPAGGRGSWHPTVMPWEQASQPAPRHPQQFAHPPQAAAAPYPVAPLPSVAPPRGAALPPAQPYHARAFSPAPAIAPENVRLMRLAEGTPHPPFAPQPYSSLPAPRPLPGMPAPHLAHTQPQSFVLKNSAALPAAYPLTFPAFPEVAGATMLAPVEPSGLNYWGPLPTEVEVTDEQIIFARGSQPADQLEPIRRTMPRASPSDETRIVRPSQRRR